MDTAVICVVQNRSWEENPCDDCDVAEGAILDDGDPETFLYACWCGVEVRVRRDDPEVAAALAEARR